MGVFFPLAATCTRCGLVDSDLFFLVSPAVGGDSLLIFGRVTATLSYYESSLFFDGEHSIMINIVCQSLRNFET